MVFLIILTLYGLIGILGLVVTSRWGSRYRLRFCLVGRLCSRRETLVFEPIFSILYSRNSIYQRESNNWSSQAKFKEPDTIV